MSERKVMQILVLNLVRDVVLVVISFYMLSCLLTLGVDGYVVLLRGAIMQTCTYMPMVLSVAVLAWLVFIWHEDTK